MESLTRPTAARQGDAKARAAQFVILLGVISLFADMTYEGARSITGPYLAVLSASATVVGFVAGFGELVGYSLRLVSGYLSDRTRKYWTMIFAGYGLNLFAVPLLALAGRWELAALFMILGRTGKAIRTPTRDAMLSHATAEVGRGWGFGLHEAIDQLGAMLGPLVVAGVLYFRGDYRTGFGLLLGPALLAVSVLVAARLLYPRPQDLEVAGPELEAEGFPRAFWLYVVAAALVAAGYADFPRGGDVSASVLGVARALPGALRAHARICRGPHPDLAARSPALEAAEAARVAGCRGDDEEAATALRTVLGTS